MNISVTSLSLLCGIIDIPPASQTYDLESVY